MELNLRRLYSDEREQMLKDLLEVMLDNPEEEDAVITALSEHLSMDHLDELQKRLP